MSSPTVPPLPDLLEAVRDVARRAGDLAVGAMAEAEGELKEDLTFVTVVDRQVEQFLYRELTDLAPGLGFLGEEYGRRGEASERFWIVDPIDGTNNLIYGLPSWGISIGLAEGGDSVLGVYHLPITRETFSAYRGGGAFLNGDRIRPREATPLHHQDCVGITSVAARRLDLRPVVGYLRLLGSIGSEVVYTARGALYGCISLGDKLVDMGAVDCIAREAGCEFIYLSGRPFRLGEWIDAPPPDEPLLIGPDWAIQELREKLKDR
jgi:myo-inositol-1(or 4)-monophosphatase